MVGKSASVSRVESDTETPSLAPNLVVHATQQRVNGVVAPPTHLGGEAIALQRVLVDGQHLRAHADQVLEALDLLGVLGNLALQFLSLHEVESPGWVWVAPGTGFERGR